MMQRAQRWVLLMVLGLTFPLAVWAAEGWARPAPQGGRSLRPAQAGFPAGVALSPAQRNRSRAARNPPATAVRPAGPGNASPRDAAAVRATATAAEGLPVPTPPVAIPLPQGESGFTSMKAVGFGGDWDLNTATGLMENPEGTRWETFLTLSAGRHEFRIVANRSWGIWWGAATDNPAAALEGNAVLKGGNLVAEIPVTGHWRVTFEEKTRAWAIDQAEGGLAPVANAGSDMTVGAGTLVQFNGTLSYDPDGEIASYAWSNGLTGPTPTRLYDEAGVYDVVLTVTDDDGNTGQDTVRVTVTGDVAHLGDLRRETIYHVLVSRFFNGDTTNDFFCRERIKAGDPHWRGDFAGLIQRLDYIQALGFTAICLSPVAENRGALDYDGTHPYDWMTADPRLETNGSRYADLVRAAHERGLKVIQAIVVNHSSNYGIRNQVWIDRLPHKFWRGAGMTVTAPYVFNWGNYTRPFREDNDNPKAPEWFQDFLHRDPWGAGPLTDPRTGTVLPLTGYRSDRFFGTDEGTLPDGWYHRNGWLTAAADASTTAGLQGKHLGTDSLDLATQNWTVKRYLNAAVRHAIDLGIDGVWLDFAGHVDRDELRTMIGDWLEKKPQLYILADVEARGSGYGLLATDRLPSELAPWWYSRTGTDPKNPDAGGFSGIAVVDYPLLRSFTGSVVAGAFAGLENLFVNDWVYGDPTFLVTGLHAPRFGPEADRRRRFAGEDWRAALAYTLVWTARGIPCLQQGEEIAFMKGAPLFPAAAGITLDQTAHAYFGPHLEAAALATTKAHPLWQHIRRLNLIRSRSPALQMGLQTNGREWGSGMSFVRNWENGRDLVVVGLAAFADQEITVERIPSGVYADAVTGQTQVVASTSTSLTFTVKGNSAGIWIRNGPGKIGTDGSFLR
ncbi:MAG: PKD domain-containing protein [Candidatus Riflebacteria bacterium]|nr:PKD domain-containing protein [Candidatus Riflebacteria bacterium]